jgi:hypothetical protein
VYDPSKPPADALCILGAGNNDHPVGGIFLHCSLNVSCMFLEIALHVP